MTLTICKNNNRVGTLTYDQEKDSFSIEYDLEWVKTGYVLSPHIPFGRLSEGICVKNFITNLLPEGNSLDELSSVLHVTKYNVFALFKAIGSEPTGAFRFLIDGCEMENDAFRAISDEELSERIQRRHIHGLVVWDNRPRLSIAGVQQKLPIMIKHGQFGFGDGNLASTHILKFAKLESHIVLNEYLSMDLAKRVGIEVPDVAILELGGEPVLLVVRFDRQMQSENIVERRHIIDGCQMLNYPPLLKYEWPHGHGRDVGHVRSGASIKQLFELTVLCDVPVVAKQKLIYWVLFNLIIQNADAHAKNISFFIDKNSIRIAPFYDMLNIGLHTDYAQELAMGIGDEYNFDNLSAQDFADFCDDAGINTKLLLTQMNQISKKLENGLKETIASLPSFCLNEQAFIKRYKESVLNNCNYISDLIKQSTKMT